ncbi:type II toxin-antitoxin system ParD family antitoxin [Pseudanabaena sp. UWO311]|uniref:ribbon-helix-helix domain-containing protein n=1 Tax=Pseudanabaena sp. UWO311 TaxID=2487337 RepID=UPI0011599679|nr:type II toxin-antitoxin system ParD family antitoxin [Pseudanabaena sp. UWO311]TYQ24810.1 type II toxin-antitoxin system ParD family antitoxin [Pseudanabaena sp. UWO311]
MNVSFPIPKELESYVQGQIQSGTYNTVADYFLSLLNQDRQRKEAQTKLVSLLQEGLNSEPELVTSAYWQDLRLSVLGTEL